MKPQPSDKLYGMPIWDLYACDTCGAVLLKNTVALHEQYHASEGKTPMVAPPRIKKCTVCGEEITIPINPDGSMQLDEYDNHMDIHED